MSTINYQAVGSYYQTAKLSGEKQLSNYLLEIRRNYMEPISIFMFKSPLENKAKRK
jgi:hypothetical protein